MIEVEKKFLLTPEQEEKLIANAEFIKKQELLNSFYDDPKYSLTKKDWWLRDRNGRFELKIPIAANRTGLTDQYEELENEEDIKKALDFLSDSDLRKELAIRDFSPFYSCLTIRRKYRKNGFAIDLDLTYFDPETTYEIAEIELLVNDKSEVDAAAAKIKEFAADHNIPYGPVRGKIIEYLKRYRLEHYETLVDAGIIRNF